MEPSRRRPNVIVPRGLQLMRVDGSFYDLVLPARPMTTPRGYQIGILDTTGVLRPVFLNGTMIKFKRRGPQDFEIIPITLPEFRHYRFNDNITSLNEAAAQYIAEIRERQRQLDEGSG